MRFENGFQARVAGLKMEFAAQTPWLIVGEFFAKRKTPAPAPERGQRAERNPRRIYRANPR
jgi:hypothetical protein